MSKPLCTMQLRGKIIDHLGLSGVSDSCTEEQAMRFADLAENSGIMDELPSGFSFSGTPLLIAFKLAFYGKAKLDSYIDEHPSAS